MLKCNLSIIGLDACFGGYSNIDLVERAFYLGTLTKQQKLNTNLSQAELVSESVIRLTKANHFSTETEKGQLQHLYI